MKRSIVAVSTFALLVCADAGCSTRHPEVDEPGSAGAPTSRTASKPVGRIGDTLDLTRADGSKVAVTLTEIIHPVTVATGKPIPGRAYFATRLTITDSGDTAIDGDVNVNVSVVGSDGQGYTPDLNDVNECQNFESGSFRLDPRESASGCVVFAVPEGVSLAKVQYRPSAGFADDSGEWLIS